MTTIQLDAFSGSVEDLAALLKEHMPPAMTAALVTELEGATTLRQSGMEKKHEQWVLATLNFLQGIDIPFYNRAPNGDRLKGDKEIPERLTLARQKLSAAEASASQAHSVANEERKKREQIEECFNALRAELAKDTSPHATAQIQAIIDIVDTAQPVGWAKIGDILRARAEAPDERGVRRITIDGREAVLRLGVGRIVHDLMANEEICSECLGLGLVKSSQPYGTGDRKPHESAFPYHHQWLVPCQVCWVGKVQKCGYCTKVTPRYQLQCACAGAVAARKVTAEAQEVERIASLPHVALADYEGKMLYVNDEFISTDEAEEYLLDRPGAVFFACQSTSDLMTLSAGDIMENMQNDATENANPEDGDDVLDFSKDAQSELNALLDVWSKQHVTPRTLWYADDVIVDVPLAAAPEG